MLDGLTPTAPALGGLIERARQRAGANPNRRVAAVLATDGFPTTCDPLAIGDIAAIAQGGANSSPAVPTFVIGVFAPDEAADATMNLDAIARAGGTTRAFIVQTNQNVTATFQQALNQIRGAALPCEYRIPEAMQGREVDYNKINVVHTAAGGQTTTIRWVASATDCAARNGGWYYDVDPRTGQTPTLIKMCPATCSVIGADRGQVDIVLGCATLTAD